MTDALRVSSAKLVVTEILFSLSGWNFTKNRGPFASEANTGRQPELS